MRSGTPCWPHPHGHRTTHDAGIGKARQTTEVISPRQQVFASRQDWRSKHDSAIRHPEMAPLTGLAMSRQAEMEGGSVDSQAPKPGADTAKQ